MASGASGCLAAELASGGRPILPAPATSRASTDGSLTETSTKLGCGCGRSTMRVNAFVEYAPDRPYQKFCKHLLHH